MIKKQDYLKLKNAELITLIRYASEILQERMVGMEPHTGRVIVPKMVRGGGDRRMLSLVKTVRNIANLDLCEAMIVVENGTALYLPEKQAEELVRAIAEIMGDGRDT